MALPAFDPAALEVWHHRLAAVADEMGLVLTRSALSPNIKERRDHSSAIADASGHLVAQAAHVPVHLGSLGLAVRACLARVSLGDGEVAIVNDPFAGGTHLPDVTLVGAVDLGPERIRCYLACRAHHADVGGATPGSMPVGRRGAPGELPAAAGERIAVGARYRRGEAAPPPRPALTIDDEGLRLAPQRFDDAVIARLLAASRAPDERRGDLAAQAAALAVGRRRLHELAARHGATVVAAAAAALRAYTARVMSRAIAALPDGVYAFADGLEDDGAGGDDLPVRLTLTVDGERAILDFSDSAAASDGSLNAPLPVTVAAVLYSFRLLCPDDTPTNEGLLEPLTILTAPGTIVDAQPPRAVAAGNVETSQRLVDVVLGALAAAAPRRIPAASAGTMSNLLLGGGVGAAAFVYYETIAGGSGAGPTGDGASAIQTHMTNTWNTPVEALEAALPLRVRRYTRRRGSGGGGAHGGGDGVIRELELLAPATVTLIGERRRRPPYGLAGGGPGLPGVDHLTRGGQVVRLPAKVSFEGHAGDLLTIETPGGGGWGKAPTGLPSWRDLLPPA